MSGIPYPGPRLGDDGSTSTNDTTEQVTQEGGEALLRRVKNWLETARTHSSEWRTEAENLFGMVAGDQWDEQDIQKLKEQQRPVITFNRMGPVIDSICGLEVNNRQEVHYLPRTAGAATPNEIFTAAAKWARDECNAEDEESDAFRDSAICGMGCTETRVDYEQDPEGLIDIQRIDMMEMFWDPSAKRRNLSDRRWHIRARRMPLEDAEAMFPGFAPEDLDAKWAEFRETPTGPHDATEAPYYRNDQSFRDSMGRAQSMVTIVFAEWFIREDYVRVVHPQTNESMDLSPQDFERINQRAQALGIPLQSAKLTRKKYMQGFFGARELKVQEGRCPWGFSINFITGKRDRNKNTWYGVARPMKDPQQWANKFFSTILHRISTTGKGVVIEKDAVDDIRKFEDKYASADSVKVVRSGALSGGKFQQLTGAAIVAPETQMMEFAISSIRDSTGVNLELIGLADRQQAGVLEAQRKQAGMTILATLFDSLRLYRKEQGKILLYMIQEYLAPGRLIRVSGDAQAAQYMPLLKDPKTVEYDVIVDEAPASPNLKEKTWMMIVQMAPMIIKLNPPPQIWAELLMYSPLPNTLVKKLNDMLTAPPNPAPPNPLAMAEVSLKQAQAESARATAVMNLSKAGVNQAGPQLQLAQLLAQAMGQQAEQAHDVGMNAMDQAHEAAMAGQDNHAALQGQLIGHIADLALQNSQQGHEQNLAAMQPPPQQAADAGAARVG